MLASDVTILRIAEPIEGMDAIKRTAEFQSICGICKESYKDPRILPCLHVFCVKCIRDIPAYHPHVETDFTKCYNVRTSDIICGDKDSPDSNANELSIESNNTSDAKECKTQSEHVTVSHNVNSDTNNSVPEQAHQDEDKTKLGNMQGTKASHTNNQNKSDEEKIRKESINAKRTRFVDCKSKHSLKRFSIPIFEEWKVDATNCDRMVTVSNKSKIVSHSKELPRSRSMGFKEGRRHVPRSKSFDSTSRLGGRERRMKSVFSDNRTTENKSRPGISSSQTLDTRNKTPCFTDKIPKQNMSMSTTNIGNKDRSKTPQERKRETFVHNTCGMSLDGCTIPTNRTDLLRKSLATKGHVIPKTSIMKDTIFDSSSKLKQDDRTKSDQFLQKRPDSFDGTVSPPPLKERRSKHVSSLQGNNKSIRPKGHGSTSAIDNMKNDFGASSHGEIQQKLNGTKRNPRLNRLVSSSSADSDSDSALSGIFSAQLRIIICPDCNGEIDIPKDETNLPKYRSFESVKPRTYNASAPEVACDLCMDLQQAVSYCTMCCENMCTHCSLSHQRQQKSITHEILDIDDDRIKKDLSKPNPFSKCDVHLDEVIKMYCSTCGKTMCRDCAMDDHKGHNYHFIDVVYQDQMVELEDFMDAAISKDNLIKNTIEDLDHSKQITSSNADDIQMDINIFLDAYITAIEKQRTLLFKQLRKIIGEREHKLNMHSEYLDQLSNDLKYSCGFIAKFVKDSTCTEVLSLKRYFINRLKYLMGEKVDLPYHVEHQVRFCPEMPGDVIDKFQMFGRVLGNTMDPTRCQLDTTGKIYRGY